MCDCLVLKLFHRRWDPRHVNHLVTMFRDISLSDSELRFVITKVIRLLKDLDLQELPPLIYQLLLLATKVSYITTFNLFSFYFLFLFNYFRTILNNRLTSLRLMSFIHF